MFPVPKWAEGQKELKVRVSCRQDGPVVTCCVEGDLENLTVAQFREALAPLPWGSWVVFDLGAVSFVDSAGLGALIGAIRRCRERGGDAVVCRPRPSVNRVLQLVGLTRMARVTPTKSEAVSYFLASAVA
jgi:anti-sigma B factor antagonist